MPHRSAPRRSGIRWTSALAALALLANAAAAEAKGTAAVCGSNRCELVSDPGVVRPLHSTFGRAPAPTPAPFYVVRFCSTSDCRGSVEWSYVYVPSVHAMRADNIGSGRVRWMQASLLRELLGPLTLGLRPYPASATWTPTTHTADDRVRPAGSVALPSLALAAVIAIAALTARSQRGTRPADPSAPRDSAWR